MNTLKRLKPAPTVIMVAFLAYATYSIRASLPDPAAGRSDLVNGLDIKVQDLPGSGVIAAQRLGGEVRDPFQVGIKPDAPAAASKPQKVAPSVPESDPLVEIVAGLTLDATFLQGRDQLAIIGGRIYSRGQHLLALDRDRVKSSSPLLVVAVNQTNVILRGNGRTYVLSYPDQLGQRKDQAREADSSMSQAVARAERDPGGQLAVFQRLLNSPLGALRKRMIGNSTPTYPPSPDSPASPTRRSQGGSAATTASSDNP